MSEVHLDSSPAAIMDDESVTSFDAIVIGAGFSGMYMVYKLRELGFSVRGYERGSDFGGTWYWNRYPGARCDCESMYYSYSFLPNLEQEWPLEERFPGQPVILNYLTTVARRLDLAKDFTFGTRVETLAFSEGPRRWTAHMSGGAIVSATYVITAVGCLSAANRPQIHGTEVFAGETYHTGDWPRDGVDLAGKRIGVIGTGASGIQAIPVIAQQAGHVTVFQRTAQFTIPAANGPLDPQFAAMWKANYREWRRRGRQSAAGIPYPRSMSSALDATAEERQQAYEAGWRLGGADFMLGSYGDVMVDERANATAADFVRAKIDEIVQDPQTAEALKPHGFPLGSKRLPMDTDYYATYNRPNVDLVDLKRTPIERITETGVRTSDADYGLDILVFATGFDAMTGPLLSIDIHGRGGRTLADYWAEGPRTYLGLAMPGFPNLFTITGPGSPSVLVNMPVAIEQHVEWIAELIVEQGVDSGTVVEATQEATEQWTAHVQEVAQMTLFPKAASWYMGANIPGKPRLFLPYVGGMEAYEGKCRAVAAAGYEGFVVSAPLAHV